MLKFTDFNQSKHKINFKFKNKKHSKSSVMKLTRTLFNSFYKTTSSKIVHIPRPMKKLNDDYQEPSEWNLPFEKTSQVKPRTFIDIHQIQSNKIGKNCEGCYQNPEYLTYHTYSYYDMERDLYCKRCRPQPSPYCKRVFEKTDEKSP